MDKTGSNRTGVSLSGLIKSFRKKQKPIIVNNITLPILSHLKYPDCLLNFENFDEYSKTLIFRASSYSARDKYSFIKLHLGSLFQEFFVTFEEHENINNFDISDILSHAKMINRKIRSNLCANNPKHYKRLHSIVKYCPCKYCTVTFSNNPQFTQAH